MFVIEGVLVFVFVDVMVMCGIVVKYVYLGDNLEVDWGWYLLQVLQFGQQVLDCVYFCVVFFINVNICMLGVGVFNGGGVVLWVVEFDVDVFDVMVVGEFNVLVVGVLLLYVVVIQFVLLMLCVLFVFEDLL